VVLVFLPLYVVESKAVVPLAYINHATPRSHDFGKRGAEFHPKPASYPAAVILQKPFWDYETAGFAVYIL
jgi:hypothetical protein